MKHMRWSDLKPGDVLELSYAAKYSEHHWGQNHYYRMAKFKITKGPIDIAEDRIFISIVDKWQNFWSCEIYKEHGALLGYLHIRPFFRLVSLGEE